MLPRTLSNFHRCTIESILTSCIMWYSSSASLVRKVLQRVVKLAQAIPRAALPSMQDLCHSRVCSRACNIIKHSTCPVHPLFTVTPSGKRYRSIRTRTSKLRDSFYPQAVRLINKCPPLPLPPQYSPHAPTLLSLLPTLSLTADKSPLK